MSERFSSDPERPAEDPRVAEANMLVELSQYMLEQIQRDAPEELWGDLGADLLTEYCLLVIHRDPQMGALLINALESREDWGHRELSSRLRDAMGSPEISDHNNTP